MKMAYDHIATVCVCCGSQDLMRSPAILMPFIADRVYQWKPVIIDESWGLKTIVAGHAYSLCNSLLCCQCKLLFLDIRFSESEMARLYESYRGESYTTLRESYEPGYQARNNDLVLGVEYLDQVENFLAPHLPKVIKILDWGGGTGINTPFRRNPGNATFIYDLSGVEVEAEVRKISQSAIHQNKYDLIVCSSLLEHLPYPRNVLAEIKRVMTMSSVLYIEVPLEKIVEENHSNSNLLNKKRHWHEHINFFSERSIIEMVTSAGMHILSFRRDKIWLEGNFHSQFLVACGLKEPNLDKGAC
jgi:SAM-dependent methyltransferase